MDLRFPLTSVTVQLLEKWSPAWQIKTEQMALISVKKLIFLTCHVKDYLKCLDGDRHLVAGSHQNPLATCHPAWWPSREQEPTSSPSGLRAVPLPLTCLFAGKTWPGGLFLVIWGPVASWLAFVALPFAGLTSRRIAGFSWPPWVVLRSQGMADSNDYQVCMSPGLPFLRLGSLFLLSLVLIIKTQRPHLGGGP